MSILFAIFSIVLIVLALFIVFKTFNRRDKVSGVNIIIALVFVIVIWYFLQWAYWRYKSLYKLTSIKEATESQTIDNKKLPKTNANNFTMSSWFYVDNWNHKFGKEKHLLQFKDGSFRITLGGTENDINIAIKTFKGGSTSRSQEAFTNQKEGYAQDSDEDSNEDEDNDENNIEGFNEGYIDNDGGPLSASGLLGSRIKDRFEETVDEISSATSSIRRANLRNERGSSSIGTSKNTGNSAQCVNCILCQIKNFPLQKWVNLTVSVYGRTLDVYIDGKLVKTCILDGISKIGKEQDLLVTLDGGFKGWTSNITYMPQACNPQEAYNIYKRGYGLSWFNQLFNKYRFKFSFLKDNVETGSIYL